MDFKTLILLSLVFTAESQYSAKIPCTEEEMCRQVLSPSVIFRCMQNNCMCLNNETKVYESCKSEDIMMVGARREKVEPLIGRTCLDDTECGLKNGFCNIYKYQCECLGNYVPSANNKACLRITRNLGPHCEEDIQCLSTIQNSTCEAGECRCSAGFHQVKSNCEKNSGYEEECMFNRQCEHIDGAKCFEQPDKTKRICECVQGLVINSDRERCLPVASAIDDECIESIQCSASLAGSECHDKRCKCRPGYHPVNSPATGKAQCVQSKAYGDKCEKEEESCYQLANPNDTNALYCSNNKVCECKKDEYVFYNGLCQYSGAHQAVSQVFMFFITTALVIQML